jgi:hypothetical protein
MRRLYVSSIVSNAEDDLFASPSNSRKKSPVARAYYSVGYAFGILIIFFGLYLMASVLERVQHQPSTNLRAEEELLVVPHPRDAAAITVPTMEAEQLKTRQAQGNAVEAEPTNSAKVEKQPEETGTMDLLKSLFELGRKDPAALIVELSHGDPLHVNIADPHEFTCPDDKHSRLDYPSLINEQNLKAFRDGVEGSFIFYQHLRKAGGTGFCDLAQRNLKHGQVPSYYCMPDNRGSLALAPWGDPKYLGDFMHSKGFRMAANEWDVFHADQADIPNVVLATTMRHPVDRWYSQYRFEHLEHRDGTDGSAPRQTLREFYDASKGWTMGTNYYVKTFIGDPDPRPPRNKGDFYWTYHKYQRKPLTWGQFSMSLHNLRRFHVLLVTEWLDSSPPLLLQALGWTSPPKQVLPHEVQVRD